MPSAVAVWPSAYGLRHSPLLQPTRPALMLLIGTLALAALVHSADTTKKKTDSLPLVADRNLDFETTEGTWMSLDVSPDGKPIVFLSDRDGAENVWTMDPDGSKTKLVSKGDNSLYASPEWTPDGNY